MTVLIRPEGQTPDDLKLSRRAVGALGGLMFSGYAVAALAKEAKPITTDDAGLVTETVTYPAPDGFDLPAYVARPEGDGPFPVVVVVSEIFGVHDYIRDVCRRLAKQGYAAIAPAFFVRVEDPGGDRPPGPGPFNEDVGDREGGLREARLHPRDRYRLALGRGVHPPCLALPPRPSGRAAYRTPHAARPTRTPTRAPRRCHGPLYRVPTHPPSDIAHPAHPPSQATTSTVLPEVANIFEQEMCVLPFQN